jgi:hypothetical protein
MIDGRNGKERNANRMLKTFVQAVHKQVRATLRQSLTDHEDFSLVPYDPSASVTWHHRVENYSKKLQFELECCE